MEERLRAIDLDAYFNLKAVQKGIRPGFLLELFRKREGYLEFIYEAFPDLHHCVEYENHDGTPLRVLFTKEKCECPKTDKSLAKFLGFDCLGIPERPYYILSISVSGTEVYTEICKKERNFISKKSRYASFEKLANKLGLTIEMNIRYVEDVNVREMLMNVERLEPDKQFELSELLRSAGLEYIRTYLQEHMPDEIPREWRIMTGLLYENMIYVSLYPLNPTSSAFLEETMYKAFSNHLDNPVAAIEQIESEFVRPYAERYKIGLEYYYSSKERLLRDYKLS